MAEKFKQIPVPLQKQILIRMAGSGLGLALVKQIVAASGGSVQVENLPQGCRFTVELP